MSEVAPTDLHDYAADALLLDGGSIHIRAIRPDDKELLLEHFASLSPRSVYFRFFNVKKRLTKAELQYLTELDFVARVGLVATLRTGDQEKIIGIGRYTRLGDGEAPRRAEVAFAVLDSHQRRGIGTLLLEHLARIARAHGITEFEADVLGENNRMLDVFSKSGFGVSRSIDGGIFHVTFPTAESEQYREASHQRERHASAQSVRAFLRPSAIAVVGASRHPDKIGARLVANLKAGGFTSPIYPVNPHAGEIAGLRAYPTVSSIGAPVDLALIAVPAVSVEEAVEDCARAGVRGVVVASAGFAEASAAGKEAQQRLLALARSSGMRLVGPNSMGVANTDPAVSMNATFAAEPPVAGNVGVLSQSGAVGVAVLHLARSRHVGISSFVSVGNKADVSGNDLLAYWAEDQGTAAIALYLESFGNPRKFAQLAPEVARVKPIVAVKAGRSLAGRRAASSHSAALANLDVAVEALFEQAGVVRTDTIEQLFDVVALLATQPAPSGPRVGVITNAGGPCILLADACEARGLVLPELGTATRDALRRFLPTEAAVANPVDLLASATPEDFARAIEIVGADADIDAVVVIHVPLIAPATDAVASAIARGAGTLAAEKPILAVLMSAPATPAPLSDGPRGRIPSYGFPEDAALALAAAERYGRWRRRPRGTALTFSPFARRVIRAVVDRVLAEAHTPRWLGVKDLASILRAADIPLAETLEVAPDQAVAAARRIGYPLIAKVGGEPTSHESDLGGVITGLKSPGAVREALSELDARMRAAGVPFERVILRREIHGGIEALVGVTSDPLFGPLLVLGYGGVLGEIVRDASFRLPPVTDVDAAEMIAALRSRTWLDGHRGAPAGDREALVSVLMRVSALVELVPELLELDLNPLKVLPPGAGAIAADGRLRIGPIG